MGSRADVGGREASAGDVLGSNIAAPPAGGPFRPLRRQRSLQSATSMDAGAVLRRARERRGLTLESISRATKIAVPTLRAIESRDVDNLPEGIYLRGFLRAYACEVGVDPESVVREYTGPVRPPASAAVAASTVRQAVQSNVTRSTGVPGRHMAAGVLIIQIVIAVGALYLLIRERESASVAATPVHVAERAEAGTTGIQNPNTKVADDRRLMRVEIATTAPCWVEATVDGRPVISRMMDSGEREAVDVENELELRVGDPSAFVFRVDGADGQPLGLPGVPATARLTRSNIHEFVAPTPAWRRR